MRGYYRTSRAVVRICPDCHGDHRDRRCGGCFGLARARARARGARLEALVVDHAPSAAPARSSPSALPPKPLPRVVRGPPRRSDPQPRKAAVKRPAALKRRGHEAGVALPASRGPAARSARPWRGSPATPLTDRRAGCSRPVRALRRHRPRQRHRLHQPVGAGEPPRLRRPARVGARAADPRVRQRRRQPSRVSTPTSAGRGSPAPSGRPTAWRCSSAPPGRTTRRAPRRPGSAAPPACSRAVVPDPTPPSVHGSAVAGASRDTSDV